MTQNEKILKDAILEYCQTHDYTPPVFQKALASLTPEPERVKAAAEAKGDAGRVPQNLDEFKKHLLNDPVAYAYYYMGRVAERYLRLTPEQRSRKNFDAIYSAIQQGFADQILPDVWAAEFRNLAADKAENPKENP